MIFFWQVYLVESKISFPRVVQKNPPRHKSRQNFSRKEVLNFYTMYLMITLGRQPHYHLVTKSFRTSSRSLAVCLHFLSDPHHIITMGHSYLCFPETILPFSVSAKFFLSRKQKSTICMFYKTKRFNNKMFHEKMYRNCARLIQVGRLHLVTKPVTISTWSLASRL